MMKKELEKGENLKNWFRTYPERLEKNILRKYWGTYDHRRICLLNWRKEWPTRQFTCWDMSNWARGACSKKGAKEEPNSSLIYFHCWLVVSERKVVWNKKWNIFPIRNFAAYFHDWALHAFHWIARAQHVTRLDPVHFEGDSEGKSKVVGGTSNGKSTGTFNDEKFAEVEAAADSCAVSVIKVTKTWNWFSAS